MKATFAIITALFCLVFCNEFSFAKDFAASDYFPLNPGKTLSYEIEMGYVEPIAYEENVWRTNNASATTSTRRDFMGIGTNIPRKIFLLELKLNEPEKSRAKTQHSAEVEVLVKKDELGVYKNAKQIFWSIDRDNLVCRETVVNSPDESIAPEGISANGISERVLLFQGKAGAKIGRSGSIKNSHDTITFNGLENLPGLNTPALHFTRRVEIGFADSTDKKEYTLYIHKQFEEHSYFVKGKGLVYLEQRIEGIPSMIWRQP